MQIHGFELIKRQEIKELDSEALFYKHIKTGAELLSIANDDENKVFGITFRTPPPDSTGVAHILEHSVLCGSRKYPVKEPFVELLKSSLQTFLNAFTYPDKTCYPVASQNLKDFYNLIDVYLDAVFYPRIDPLIFQQEGWHYELFEAAGPITLKGVVYSEMKGAYSSPDNIMARYAQQSLFPDNTYSLESGGDPKIIPELTYDMFYEFHRKFYHPSNSRIYFYGNDNLEERLKLIDKYLKDYKKINVVSRIGLQSKFPAPKKVDIPFIAEAEAGKNPKGMVTVNWLLDDTLDVRTNFTMQILNHILIGMPASPLKRALIESGLGEGLAGVGLENELRQMYYSTGLKGIDVKNADKVEEIIIQTLSGLSKAGIDPLTIEAAINTIEFALRENNTGAYPRGLSLMLRSLTAWLYDEDPLAMVAFDEPFREIKKQNATNPSFFADMIGKYFLNNSHRTTVVLYPDTELGEKERISLQHELEQKKRSMSMVNIRDLVENTNKLKSMQETPDTEEAVASIPCLKLSEIDKKNKIIPILTGQDEVKYYYHDIFTNGILYFDIGLCLNVLPQKYLPYMSVFAKALMEMGTEKEDYISFSQRISRKTGGITRTSFSSMIKDTENPATWLFLRGKALISQVDDLFGILRDMLLSVRMDNRERFKQIVLETKAGMEQSLIAYGNRIVNLRIQSHFNKAAWAEEQMSGIQELFFLRELEEKIDGNWQDVLGDLLEIRRILVNKNNIIINATIDEKNWKDCKERTRNILDAVPSAGINPSAWMPEHPVEFEGLLIPSTVNYVGKGINLYKLGYIYNGSINVITHLLRTSYLWENVRVQGGAYGVMCQFNRMSGVFTLVSYRDPNISKTLDIYNRASSFLRNIDMPESELHKSIIGAIGDIDAYMLPDAMGYTSMLWALNGNTEAGRQKMRDNVLGTSLSDLKNFADVLDHIKDNGITKILGGKSAFNEAYTGKESPEFVKVL